MKPRYLIPWIPFIGLVYVLFISSFVFNKYKSDWPSTWYTKYTWGSNWAYWVTIPAQGFGIAFILLNS